MLDTKIETFLKVVQLGSYTQAAISLHMTQPAVTVQIQKLEQHYGCKLIDSSKRSVKLTKAGTRLYQYMTAQKANEEQFIKSLLNLESSLHIGATLSIADFYLPEILTKYLTTKGTRFSVRVGNTSQLLEFLGKGEIDCAFVEGIFDSGLYNAQIFRQSKFRPVASKNHPLAHKKTCLEQLHQYPLALREEGSGTREILGAILRHQNDSFDSFTQIAELGSFVLIKELLYHSNAVTFAYDAVVEKEIQQGKLVFLDVENATITHPLHFLSRKGDERKKIYETLYQELLEQNL